MLDLIKPPETLEFQEWNYGAFSVYQVGAELGGECFLLVTKGGGTALFDAGFGFCADKTYANIQKALQGKQLDWIVFTHSHYDHVAAAGYIHDRMRHAKVVASAHAAQVFNRSGAFVTMHCLDESQAAARGIEHPAAFSENIAVDVVVGEGDHFSIGELDFCVLAAPGHTKCCLAFWCEQEKILVTCETSGAICGPLQEGIEVPEGVSYYVDFNLLISFNQSLEHIQRIQQLPAEVVIGTHYGCVSGQEIPAMWASANYWLDYMRALATEMYEQGASVDEIIARFKAEFYWRGVSHLQPEPAFDLNASYAIPVMLRDCCGYEIPSRG